MKVLNSVETQAVSGAGLLSSGLSVVGSTLGTVMEFVGWKNAKTNAESLGRNAGLVVDSAFEAVSSFFKLVFKK